MPFDILDEGGEPNAGPYRAPIFSMQLFHNSNAIGTTGRLYGDWNVFWEERKMAIEEQAGFFPFEIRVNRMLLQCDNYSRLFDYESNCKTILDSLNEAKIRVLNMPEHLSFIVNTPDDSAPKLE